MGNYTPQSADSTELFFFAPHQCHNVQSKAKTIQDKNNKQVKPTVCVQLPHYSLHYMTLECKYNLVHVHVLYYKSTSQLAMMAHPKWKFLDGKLPRGRYNNTSCAISRIINKTTSFSGTYLYFYLASSNHRQCPD